MTTPRFLKTNPLNFTPMARTPWAGESIASIKKSYGHKNIPEKIGESWEISTSDEFLSTISDTTSQKTLRSVLETNPREILGAKTAERFGAHSPILLKWIEAASPLSVQIHPAHNHPALSNKECGKPEAWLVLATQPKACIYVGFKEGLSRAEIEALLDADNVEACLNRIEPKPFDFISIPAGCVHALGAGILIAEPQLVLPAKNGITWRISDWSRRYNSEGIEDPNGQARELHGTLARSAINWNLPRGHEVERNLSRQVTHGVRFLGNATNPFGAQIFTSPGKYPRNQLFAGEFELITVWAGKATLLCTTSNETCELVGGESAIVSAQVTQMKLTAEAANGQNPGIAFFSLNPESTAWHS